MNRLASLALLLKGFCIGITNVIPGASGGSIALITGIYERLINAIKGINVRFLVPLFKRQGDEAKRLFLSMDFSFLLPVGVGAAGGTVLLSFFLRYLLGEHAAATYSFFFGLILASAIMIGRQERIRPRHVLLVVAGFAATWFLVGLRGSTTGGTTSPVMLVIVGMLALSSMIMPGLSGSFILVVLGQYDHLIELFTTFIEELVAFRLGPVLFHAGFSLALVGVGGIIGLLLFARVIGYLLKRWKAGTMVTLIGIMLGGLRDPWERIAAESTPAWLVVTLAIAGAATILAIEMLASKAKHKARVEREKRVETLKAGIHASSTTSVAALSEGLQLPREEIVTLIEGWREWFGVVIDGDHVSCPREHHEAFLKAIDELLQRAEPGPDVSELERDYNS